MGEDDSIDSFDGCAEGFGAGQVTDDELGRVGEHTGGAGLVTYECPDSLALF